VRLADSRHQRDALSVRMFDMRERVEGVNGRRNPTWGVKPNCERRKEKIDCTEKRWIQEEGRRSEENSRFKACNQKNEEEWTEVENII